MTADANEPVEISCIILEIRDKSIKITDGTQESFTDPKTGEIKERVKWYFLPRSQVEEDLDGLKVGETTTLTVPEWLAADKGLI